MRITVLVENATPSSRLAARHGLALWIEAAGRRVLFDVGPDGSALANAAALGIDVGTADAAVLSHGHADHGGGLGAYLAATHAASTPLYVRPHAFDEHLSGTVAAHHDISLDAGLAASPRIVTTGARHRIAPGLTLFATPSRAYPAPASNNRLFMRDAATGSLVLDDFAHEQSLLVQEDGRRVLISACSHAGILNIMTEAERIAAAPLDAVVAGFHLMAPSAGTSADAQTVAALARELARRPACYYTFHCTGLDAFAHLRDELGPRVRYLACGSSLTLP